MQTSNWINRAFRTTISQDRPFALGVVVVIELRIGLVIFACLTMAACDNAGSALKTGVGDFAKEATRTASG